jgi:hypothetical protein
MNEDDGSHRKNQNLNLLIKDIANEKNEGVLDDDDETLSVFQDGLPRKKKLNTLLGGNDHEDDEDGSGDERNSSTDFGKIDIRVNAHKKFDIKQLKIEIWKIITLKGIPQISHKTQNRIDDKRDFCFTDLMVIFENHIENREMIECLSVPQTFVCLLHLANENSLKFERKLNEIPEDEDDDEFVFKRPESHMDEMTSHALSVIM